MRFSDEGLTVGKHTKLDTGWCRDHQFDVQMLRHEKAL